MVAEQADSSTPCARCVTCGAEIAARETGRPRKYCNEACRKKAGRNNDRGSTPPESGLPGVGSAAPRPGRRPQGRPGREGILALRCGG